MRDSLCPRVWTGRTPAFACCPAGTLQPLLTPLTHSPSLHYVQRTLRLSNISKSFGGVKALQDVSLAVDQGKIYTLVGENGCGKSTLIKIIAGVYSADSGTIVIDGKEHHTSDRSTPSAPASRSFTRIFLSFPT